ncbi:shufflon system plasmid conjugative transfer pilus tip adhesin PilV [Escherichia coli]|nr:shufflon system plasmid conjugative transfer pilus tip adhesin PilV [Escherichia coli]
MKNMKKGVWQIGDGVGGWALGIAGLAMLVIPTLFYFSNDQSYSNAAQHATRVSNAAEKFISDNAATISAGATPTAPYVFNTQTLIDNGYLPTGFAPKNTFSQDYQIRVLEPTANKFQTLVVTINGQALSDSAARKIATRIGADGGFVDKGIAKGSLGAWTQDLAAFGVSPGNGHIAIAQFYKNTVSSNDYLYRKSVPGHPELNTMSTALNMGGNDVSHAKNIDASGNVTSSATVQGAAVNSTGNMTATGTVTAQTTNTAGETYTGGWFRTRGDTGWYSEKWGGGFHMTDSSWIRAYQNKGIYTGGQVQAGTVQSNGRMTANEFLQINGVATAGWGCSPNGLVGRDAAGGILSCQSGVWRRNIGSTVLTGLIGNGQQIPLPTGFSQNQCTWSVSNSENPHGWKPNYFAGQVAAVDANRVVTCGYYDEYVFHPGTNRTDLTGKCSFIISCS